MDWTCEKTANSLSPFPTEVHLRSRKGAGERMRKRVEESKTSFSSLHGTQADRGRGKQTVPASLQMQLSLPSAQKLPLQG